MPTARARPLATPTRVLIALLVAFGLGCASRSAAPREEPAATDWVSTLHRDHPLVGRIWDVRHERWADESDLDAAVRAAHFVALGETHDNPDHHLIEAKLLRAMVSGGRRPALAFEMLDTGQQSAVDAALAEEPRSADAIARAVDWEDSGWPDFSLYRPVFEVPVDAGLRIVAANLPDGLVKNIVHQGPSAMPTSVRALLDRAGPLSEDAKRAMREEMSESHCGQLPDSLLEPMAIAQRARDAQMAASLLAAEGRDGAALVAGSGHARSDRGVPLYLAREAQGKSSLSVALLEVLPGRRTPESYAPAFGPGPLPFDYVVFTPATERGDPCEGLRKRRPPPRPAPAPTFALR